jgi:hypothetical protein
MWVGQTSIDSLIAPFHVLDQVTFAALIFTTQKNTVRGEVIGHGCTNSSLSCPTAAIVRQIKHLRSHGAPAHTPLCTVGPSLRPLPPTSITKLLRQGGLAHTATTGSQLPPIHLHALRATGATALLSIHQKEIQLLDGWKSDSMLRYLHLQCHSRMCGYVSLMLLGSTNPSTIL